MLVAVCAPTLPYHPPSTSPRHFHTIAAAIHWLMQAIESWFVQPQMWRGRCVSESSLRNWAQSFRHVFIERICRQSRLMERTSPQTVPSKLVRPDRWAESTFVLRCTYVPRRNLVVLVYPNLICWKHELSPAVQHPLNTQKLEDRFVRTFSSSWLFICCLIRCGSMLLKTDFWSVLFFCFLRFIFLTEAKQILIIFDPALFFVHNKKN